MNPPEQPADGLADLLKSHYAATPDARFAADLLNQLAAELPVRRSRWQPVWRPSPRNLVFAGLAAAVLVVLGVFYVPALFATNPNSSIDVVNRPGQAPEAIKLLGARANVDALAPYLSSPDVNIATATALTLGQKGDDKAARYLEAALQKEERPELRPALFVGLSNTKSEVKVNPAPALDALHDPTRPVSERAAAIQMLSRKQIYHGLPALVIALGDQNALIRTGAYNAIVRIMQRDYGFRAGAPERDRARVLAAIKDDIARIDWNTPGLPD